MCLTQFFQRRFTLLLLFPLVLLALPVPASAEQPTATLSSFSGPVQLTLQGVSDIEATPGSILRAGDLIVTGEDAQAVLHLSDAALSPSMKTQASTSRCYLKSRKARPELRF